MVKMQNIEMNLSKIKILDNITIHAKPNSFVGITGPNGSGKTTLLKCLYRVLKPDNGTIFIDDRLLWSLSVKESARKIAVLAQHNYYNFDFTVEEIVLMGRSPHKKNMEMDTPNDYKIVSDSMTKAGVLEYKDRIFSTLSGGEQQRVILARALAQSTPCLILDEPTNHLDIKYQFQLLDIVKKLDATIIAAMHDLNIASLYCDYIYMLKDGKVYAQGSPEEVLTTDLIWEVYGVRAQVKTDDEGRKHILYRP